MSGCVCVLSSRPGGVVGGADLNDYMLSVFSFSTTVSCSLVSAVSVATTVGLSVGAVAVTSLTGCVSLAAGSWKIKL